MTRPGQSRFKNIVNFPGIKRILGEHNNDCPVVYMSLKNFTITLIVRLPWVSQQALLFRGDFYGIRWNCSCQNLAAS